MANYIKGTKIQENSISETKLDSSLQSWKETVTNHINNNDNPHNITKSSIGLDNVTNDAQVKRSELGVANGVATLDSTGKVPSGQLPSYVDDVIEGYLYNGVFYKDTSYTTSIVGESGKIYIDLPTNKTYRWTGSVYGVISETIALGETSSTAYRGDRGKIAYDHSQSAHAPSNAQANVIETIKVNGTALTPNSKAVDITVPTVGNGTITIKQGGTSKGTFTTNQNGNTTIELTDTNTTYTAGDGLSLSGTTFSNNGVRSIATGTTNGTISVNTNGNISNIGVYGLKSAAYTDSSAYAAASHTHSYLPLSGGTLSGSDRTLLRLKSSNSLGPIIDFLNPNGDSVASFGHIPSNTNYGTFLNNVEGQIGLLLSNDGVAYLTTNTNYLTKNYTILHSGNYNSYAPKLDGTGASGTWGINISGNAATATNADKLDGFHESDFSRHITGTARTTGTKYFKLGNLPKSSDSTWDAFLIQGEIGGWGSIQKTVLNVCVGRRNSVIFCGYTQGLWNRNLGIDIGVNDAGEIVLIVTGQYCAWTLDLHTIQGTISYTGTTFTPTDTNFVLLSASNNVSKSLADGTVEKATKLANSRTIWGQSFDGTGNVSGNIDPMASSSFHCGTNTNQWHFVYTNNLYAKSGSNLGIGANNTTHMFINTSGNVLIGTTTDANLGKLQVNGSISMGNSGSSELYMNRGGRNIFIATQNNGSFAWRVNGEASNVMMLSASGHLLIGATTDSDFHLDVSGNARVANLTAANGTFSGNLIASGDVTAGSDIRYKDKIQDLRLSVHDIALAPAFTYKWNNREDDALVHIGSSAQYWLNTDAKDAVYYDKQNDFYHLNYASLALCNTIILARGIETQEEKIARLEERINELEDKLRQYDSCR